MSAKTVAVVVFDMLSSFNYWCILIIIVFLILYREGNDPDDYSRLTYRKLLEEVCRFANVLKSNGIVKGDRVAIYMPMILETVIAMLACSRIGAVHSIVVSEKKSINIIS